MLRPVSNPAPASDPEADPSDPSIRGRTQAALALAIVLALVPSLGPVPALAAVAVLGATLALSTRRDLGSFPLLVLVAVGVGLRLANAGQGSDVLVVTRAAIDAVIDGRNPYAVGYDVSVPPGAPFPYGPLTLLWYLPFHETPDRMELFAATAVMTVLALTRRPIGLAVYAASPVVVKLALDGSNDTSAGLLILAALVVAESRPVAGAALLAVATAFKPYALAWLPGLVALAGVPAIGAFGAVSAPLWAPVLLWGPGTYLEALRAAEQVHTRPYASLAAAIDAIVKHPPSRQLYLVTSYGAGAIGAAVALARTRSHDALVIGGTLVFAATLYLGYWATFAYVSAVAPILCWKLDGWLARPGLSSAR
jgi:hypothetical protein